MKIIKFREEADRLNVSEEAVRKVFEKSVSEGKIHGIIDAENGEIICYEPEEMNRLAKRLIYGRVTLEELARELNLKMNHVRLIIKFLEEKRFGGTYTSDSTFLSDVTVKEKEAFLCPHCGAPYRETIPPGTFQVKCAYCGATILVPRKIGGLFQPCSNHPEELAVGLCNTCGRNLCGDCLFVMDVMGSGEGAQRGYFHICSDCARKKRGSQQAAAIFCIFMMFLMGIIFLAIPGAAIASLFMILMGLLFIALGTSNPYERLPTVRRVMEKMSELNVRAEKVKAAMSPEEVEDLYGKMRVPITDIWTGKMTEESETDRILEKYMQSGLSRKEAIFKMAGEKGLEIKPGLHVLPTIGDALSELKKEMKEATLARLMEEAEKMSKDSAKLYERLQQAYTYIYSDARQGLESKIESLMKQGLSREEAIYQLAKKEGILPKENQK